MMTIRVYRRSPNGDSTEVKPRSVVALPGGIPEKFTMIWPACACQLCKDFRTAQHTKP